MISENSDHIAGIFDARYLWNDPDVTTGSSVVDARVPDANLDAVLFTLGVEFWTDFGGTI